MIKKWKRLFSLIILSGMLWMTLPVFHTFVYASNDDSIENEVDDSNNNAFPGTSPWLKGNQDNSIYSEGIDTEEESDDIEAKKPGRVEKYFAELVRNTASGLIGILQKNISASLDRIVYGRVGSGYPDRVNIYGFELRLGNPYGVTGAVTYSILRSIVFILLAVSFVFLLAKSTWSGQTAKSREEIKSGLFLLVSKFSVLMLMPFILDVFLYVRDILLYGLKQVTGQMIAGGATLSISKAFLLNAERSGTFVDALMYLGTVGLTIYFVFIYVAIAIDMLVCFVSFPIICVFHSKKKDLINNWMMTMLSDIITPVIDAVLLLIPLLTSLMLSDTIRGVSIIQLVMCVLVIPARNRIKGLLGVQSNDQAGIRGAMALMVLGRALMGGIKSGAGKIGEIYGDVQKSRMHKELGDADREEENDLLSAYTGSSDASRKEDGLQGLDEQDIPEMENSAGEDRDLHENDVGIEDESALHQEGGEAVDDSLADNELGTDASADIEDGYQDGPLPPNNIEETPDGSSEEMTALEGDAESESELNSGADPVNKPEGNPIKKDGSTAPEAEGASEADNEEESPEEQERPSPLTRAQVLRQLDDQTERKQENIDALKAEKAALLEDDKRLRRRQLDEDKGSENYHEMERQRADIGIRAAAVDKQIANENRELNNLRRQVRTLQGHGQNAVPSVFDDKRAEIIAKRATISNFEQPEFQKSLTNAQKQELYRKRAIATAGKALTSASAGVAAGLTLGGASMFMGSSTSAMMAAGGLSGGAQLGGYGADMVIAAGQAGMRTYKNHKGGSPSDPGARVIQGDFTNTANPVEEQTTYVNPSDTVVRPHPAHEQPVENVVHQETVQMAEQIHQDAAKAMKKVLGAEGDLRSSVGLKAMQRANIEAEKVIVSMKEEGLSVTAAAERDKRIELQTEALTEVILKRMEFESIYERGTDQYKVAREYVMDCIKKIVEEKNKPIF